jgi:hypothetical protein
MKALNVIGAIVSVIIIVLAGIAVAAAASLLLVQSASATDVMTSTTVGGQQEAVSTTTTTTNNISNALLGSLFLVGEDELTSFNPINETYIEISFVGNVTITPPNATTTATTINATQTGNVTVNIQPNGLEFGQGQSLIVTEGDDSAEQENATSTFVDISRTNPDGTGNGTGVVFFSTNSTGQLAFLDNMLAIYQHEFSLEGGTIRMWEWKGGMLPFESGVNSTTTTTNNVSNALLGSMFLIEEAEGTSFNPINETYIEISFVGNATITPPNATTTINATETGNATLNIQPNGVTFAQGQGLYVTEDDDGGAAAEENATNTFVELSRVGPDGTGNGTGVVFFSTNSTGQLAFLDNMLAIFQHEFSPEGDTIRMWEWKGGTLPFESGAAATPTTGDGGTTPGGGTTIIISRGGATTIIIPDGGTAPPRNATDLGQYGNVAP